MRKVHAAFLRVPSEPIAEFGTHKRDQALAHRNLVLRQQASQRRRGELDAYILTHRLEVNVARTVSIRTSANAILTGTKTATSRPAATT